MAQERVAAGEVDYPQSQFDRQTELAEKGINTKSALDEARRDLAKAADEQAAAVEGVDSARAALGGDPISRPTSIRLYSRRWLTATRPPMSLAQTTVARAGRRRRQPGLAFKVGQFVAAGTPLFSLVEIGDTWVEANFKETQLTG